MTILKSILLLGVAVCLFLSLAYAFNQSERAECYEWRNQFQSLNGRALAEWANAWQSWQNEQCEAQGIKVWVK